MPTANCNCRGSWIVTDPQEGWVDAVCSTCGTASRAWFRDGVLKAPRVGA